MLYVLLVIVPIVQAIHYSGYKWNGLAPLDDFVGLDNFKQASRTTCSAARCATTSIILVAVAAASSCRSRSAWRCSLNQRLKGGALLRVLFFAPFVLSEVVTAVIFRWCSSPAGWPTTRSSASDSARRRSGSPTHIVLYTSSS